MSIPRDVKEFLDGYPGSNDDPRLSANLRFYSNMQRCQPNRLLIDDLHAQWQGDYDTLEWEHGYIQWLFPIREHGMNYQSQPLQPHEIKAMTADADIMNRVLTSYRLMLDFYGMRLECEETGLVDASLPPRDAPARYKNLMRSTHNNLRITRILKSLSELGLGHLNAGLLLHVLNEQSERQNLVSSALLGSMDRWWANCFRDPKERTWIAEQIQKVRRKDGFVFTRQMYTAALQRRRERGSFEDATEETTKPEGGGVPMM